MRSEHSWTSWCDECSTLIISHIKIKIFFMWTECSKTGILVDSMLWCICSVMTHVRQNVVDKHHFTGNASVTPVYLRPYTPMTFSLPPRVCIMCLFWCCDCQIACIVKWLVKVWCNWNNWVLSYLLSYASPIYSRWTGTFAETIKLACVRLVVKEGHNKENRRRCTAA